MNNNMLLCCAPFICTISAEQPTLTQVQTGVQYIRITYPFDTQVYTNLQYIWTTNLWNTEVYTGMQYTLTAAPVIQRPNTSPEWPNPSEQPTFKIQRCTEQASVVIQRPNTLPVWSAGVSFRTQRGVTTCEIETLYHCANTFSLMPFTILIPYWMAGPMAIG